MATFTAVVINAGSQVVIANIGGWRFRWFSLLEHILLDRGRELEATLRIFSHPQVIKSMKLVIPLHFIYMKEITHFLILAGSAFYLI